MEEEESEWCSSDVNPEFFKVYLPDQSSNQLSIPQVFVKHYINGVFPQKSMLLVTGPNKRSWVVYTKKTNDKFLFDKGWEVFVKDNSLKVGEFLLFTYFASSNHFDVSIYGINGCGRANSTPYNKKIKLEPEDEVHGVSPINESYNSKVHKAAFSVLNDEIRLKDSDLQPHRKRGRPSRFFYVAGGSRALGRKESSIREVRWTGKASKCPRFEAVMRPTYLNSGRLSAPLHFIKKYFKPGTHEVKLVVSGTSWPVKLTHYVDRSARFSKGWLGFVRGNNLQCQDVCVFELKSSKTGPAFGVTIIRKT